MKLKKTSLIILIVTVLAILLGYIVSYANDGTIYVNLQRLNLNGVGYSKGSDSKYSEVVWDIRTYNSKSASDVSAKQRNLYCIKGDYSTTWGGDNGNHNTIVEYNLSYDFQKDRNKLINLLSNGNDANKVILDLLDSNKYYRELLWIFDNTYSEGQSITDYLANMYGATYSYDEEYTPHNFDFDDGRTVAVSTLLTSDDIKAVEKLAIWYFTNYKLDGNEGFKNYLLNITTDGTSYYELPDDRKKLASLLYDSIIKNAQANASKYTEQNGYQLDATAEIDVSDLQKNGDKYVLNSKRVGTKNVLGPIKIKSGSCTNITLKVTDESGKEINYTFADANGATINNTTLKDQIGKTGGFYISVDRGNEKEINLDFGITSQRTKKTLWLQGTETTNAITLNAEQPLVEVTNTPETVTTKLVANTDEFDLALRKYITEVNGKQLTDKRLPNISTDTLKTGTTATYNHRKDPVVIKENDVVTYSITIYNEGNKTGYASQVIDQLPTGLINSTENASTITSKDKSGKDRNTYKLSYNTTLNTLTFDIVNTTEAHAKSLSAYSEQSGLDYETITIKCKVVEQPDTKNQKILTNVAWINAAYDSEAGKVAVDRDSQPETKPNVNKGNMENYKGKTDNKSDLSDKNNFYKGEQDDDDFEKLVLMPEIKKFDLALFKHIAAISKDQTIEDGEYITDNGKIDGTYLRAPVVKSIENGKVVYEEDSKEALTVEEGDYVLYTIRVYNEGEINGYASKIKDTLPIGLEFVSNNEEYNGIWDLEGYDSDGRQVVSTTWYAKGQGAELNSVPGDTNYTANLLKALKPTEAISDENPDYLDAQILCKVVEKETSNRVLVNYAQISDDSDEDGNPVDDIDSTPDKWIDGDDDQDIERIKLQCFDLSLRKFITQVNGKDLKDSNGKYTREPVVDVTGLANGTSTTATYTHTKKPVSLQKGDKVVYTIRVYNEGDIKGFASEVTDYLPPYLTYVTDSEINQKYGWTISEDGRKAVTTYLKDEELQGFDGEKLDYKDVQIECAIANNAPVKQNITNIAEISEYKYNDNVVVKDIDSTADNMESGNYLPKDEDLPGYKDSEMDKTYIPGNEDDDDFEKVYIKDFDLALRKFITQVGNNEVTTRIPQVKNDNGKITYEHPKEALTVHVGDVVTYTIRIYNEGEISGYANVVSDDIPEYLEYLPEESTNVKYMWKMYDENGNETDKAENAKRIKTEYLSKENGENNLIKAFDGKTLDYKDIKVAFKVKDPNSNTYIITNHAQISDDTDENGKPIDDKDSETDKWNDGEDDQDIENIKVEYFDLALLKYVTKVIVEENGKQSITETGYNGLEDPEPVVKVELHRKKLSDVIVKFGYGIKITNEGDIPGYATEITDYIPEGLKFVAADNPNWTDEGNNVISTRQLEGTLLQPGESATVEVILTWINGADNLAEKTNTAEISEDKNEYDVPDRDSTPDNQIPGEDDIDIAKVILTIATGGPKTYITLTLGLLSIVLVGVALIKKYVI